MILTIWGLVVVCSQPASAQATTTSTDPYVAGEQVTPPNTLPAGGPAPAQGNGTAAPGINPGQARPANLMPWDSSIPVNSIDQSSNQLSLPYGPGSLTAPYTLGPDLSGSIPAPSSMPGAIPSVLQVPAGESPYALQVNVCPQGGLPDSDPPTVRTGRQSTQDYGLYFGNNAKTNDYGYPILQNPDRVGPVNQQDDRPRICNYPGQYGCQRNAQPNLPNSSYVDTGTGLHTLFQGPDLQARQTIAPY